MKRLYYFVADAAQIALQSIFAHKLRAFLTLIGIIIGVASVVVVGVVVAGAVLLAAAAVVPGAAVVGAVPAPSSEQAANVSVARARSVVRSLGIPPT